MATLATTGCLGGGGGGGGGGEAAEITVTADAFEDGGSIPDKYAKSGDNVSPKLSLEGVPEEGVDGDLAVVMTDEDTDGPTIHWAMWSIPARRSVIPEGVEQTSSLLRLGNALQAENDLGTVGYTGPDPPSGETHTYKFHVYALASEIDVEAGAPASDARSAIQDADLAAEGSLEGTYGG